MERLRPKDFREPDGSRFKHNFIFYNHSILHVGVVMNRDPNVSS
jgi:hypothetical protein